MIMRFFEKKMPHRHTRPRPSLTHLLTHWKRYWAWCWYMYLKHRSVWCRHMFFFCYWTIHSAASSYVQAVSRRLSLKTMQHSPKHVHASGTTYLLRSLLSFFLQNNPALIFIRPVGDITPISAQTGCQCRILGACALWWHCWQELATVLPSFWLTHSLLGKFGLEFVFLWLQREFQRLQHSVIDAVLHHYVCHLACMNCHNWNVFANTNNLWSDTCLQNNFLECDLLEYHLLVLVLHSYCVAAAMSQHEWYNFSTGSIWPAWCSVTASFPHSSPKRLCSF